MRTFRSCSSVPSLHRHRRFWCAARMTHRDGEQRAPSSSRDRHLMIWRTGWMVPTGAVASQGASWRWSCKVVLPRPNSHTDSITPPNNDHRQHHASHLPCKYIRTPLEQSFCWIHLPEQEKLVHDCISINRPLLGSVIYFDTCQTVMRDRCLQKKPQSDPTPSLDLRKAVEPEL